jgi:hypothetical protein
MARGDVVNNMRVDLSAGGTVDIQPGSGVEYEIQCIGGTAVGFALRGNNGSSVTTNQGLGGWDNYGVTTSLGNVGLGRRPRLLLENANFIRIFETASASIEFVWSGIQTK